MACWLWSCRAAPGPSKIILASGRRVVRDLKKEYLLLKKALRAHVQSHENLLRDSQLLPSVPGVGEITAWDILAEMPDVNEFENAQSVAAGCPLGGLAWRPGALWADRLGAARAKIEQQREASHDLVQER